MKQENKKVTLFIQCLVDSIYPEVGEAMVTVFNKLGIALHFPLDQTCCGQPAFNAGYWREARMAARRFIEIFEKAETIVCPSGSCVHMVKHHYPELFKNQPEWLTRAQNVSEKTFEFSEYLVDNLGVEDLGAAYSGKVTYHDSCQSLRGLGIRQQPRTLIRNVRNVEFTEMKKSEACCGFGGIFSVKYPEISTAILEDKVKNIIDSRADVVVGVDMSCLLNIQGLLSRKKSGVKVMHIAELLAG
ncbi:MAG: (Fe-S)-binding protein [Desulfobacterales bacterium]|jgi:L-lactate dehydrogenase complex protein LldE